MVSESVQYYDSCIMVSAHVPHVPRTRTTVMFYKFMRLARVLLFFTTVLAACNPDSNPVNEKDSVPVIDSSAVKKEMLQDSVIHMVDYSLVTQKQIAQDVHLTWLSADTIRYLIYYNSLLSGNSFSLKGLAVDTSHGRRETELLVKDEPVLMRNFEALNSECKLEIRVEKANLRRAFISAKGCKAGDLGELNSPSVLKMNCYWLTRDTTHAVFPGPK